MKNFIRFTITLIVGIIAFGFQSCGTSGKDKTNDAEDSVVVDFGASVDEDGNIVVTETDNEAGEYIGVVEEVEANPIDESLERLANAMAEYVKASAAGNDILKKTYGEDVRTEVKFLNSHKDEMTDKQKELYSKLNNIEI